MLATPLRCSGTGPSTGYTTSGGRSTTPRRQHPAVPHLVAEGGATATCPYDRDNRPRPVRGHQDLTGEPQERHEGACSLAAQELPSALSVPCTPVALTHPEPPHLTRLPPVPVVRPGPEIRFGLTYASRFVAERTRAVPFAWDLWRNCSQGRSLDDGLGRVANIEVQGGTAGALGSSAVRAERYALLGFRSCRGLTRARRECCSRACGKCCASGTRLSSGLGKERPLPAWWSTC